MQKNNISAFYELYMLALCLLCTPFAYANESLIKLQEGMPYGEVKKILIAQGWQGINNQQIENSSLYATEIYNQGMTEVVDCISMALDGCQFRFQKDDQILEIKTITRQLIVDSFGIIKP
jgi:hypothetical protein